MFNLSHILWIYEFMEILWEGEMRREGMWNLFPTWEGDGVRVSDGGLHDFLAN